MDVSHFSQMLADIPVSSITVFAVVLTILRVGLLRIPSAGARAFCEVIEAALIAVVLVFMIIQPFVMKSFYIPSGSMLPTLIDDDHIVVNKIEYRFEQPHDEDVIVFVAPQRALDEAPEGAGEDSGPTNYIKRMMGTAGDIIETRHGYITINGQEESHSDIRRVFNLNDSDRQHVKIEANDVMVYDGAWTHYDAEQVAQQFSMAGASVTFHPGETIRNGQVLDEPYTAEDPAYDFKIVNGESVRTDPDGAGVRINGQEPHTEDESNMVQQPPGPVPPGFVLAMGDNRNDSNDSTLWGPLEANRIVGKASIIFWPIDRMRRIH